MFSLFKIFFKTHLPKMHVFSSIVFMIKCAFKKATSSEALLAATAAVGTAFNRVKGSDN